MDKAKEKITEPMKDKAKSISDKAKQKLNPDSIKPEAAKSDAPPNPEDDYNNNDFMATVNIKY